VKRIVKRSEQLSATWRGGTTRAIYAYPPEQIDNLAAAHLWLGTATIARDGAYSVFAARTRIHLPMLGNGLRLHFQEPSEICLLKSFEQIRFAGDRPLAVTLVDGEIEAFNAIFHPSVHAEVDTHQVSTEQRMISLSSEPLPSDTNGNVPLALQLLYAVNGSCVVALPNGESHMLAMGDAYIGGANEAIQLHYCDRAVAVIRARCSPFC